jgi:opacity protein-like surface antigen
MLHRILFVVAAAALLAGAAAAQAPAVGFGVKAGLNLSSVNLDDLDASTRTGFIGGAFVTLPAGGLNLQGELLYSVKGFKEGVLDEDGAFDYRERFIQIPILAKIPIPMIAVTPSIYAGPAISFPLKGEISIGDSWQEIEEDAESGVWSLIVGADMVLANGLLLDLRYDMGLSSVRDVEIGDVTKEMKDRTISVMAGFKF